jgi:hypothetical protein
MFSGQPAFAFEARHCTSLPRTRLPWIRVGEATVQRDRTPIAKILRGVHLDVSEEHFTFRQHADISSYVIISTVLQNSHPGYHLWTRLFFACRRDAQCASFDFSNSDSINFPTSVQVFRSRGRTLITARGFDERSSKWSVDYYLIDGDRLTKCR